MKRLICAVAVIFFSLYSAYPTFAGIRSEIVKEILEKALKTSGVQTGEYAMRETAETTIEKISDRYGRQAVNLIADGGIELVEGTHLYGDDVVRYALQASPQARRVFAENLREMLPLVRRFGIETVELEARAPGTAAKVFDLFGKKEGNTIAREAATEDIPRIIGYAERADSNATRQLLAQTYEKEGKSLFERIPPKLVLATGLSSAMILGVHDATAPLREAGKTISKNKDLGVQVANKATYYFFIIVFLVIILLFWRFKLLPGFVWREKSKKSPALNFDRK